MKTPAMLPAVIVALALLGTAGRPAVAEGPPPVAILLAAEGPVTWRPAGGEAFLPASGGERLFTGAMVRTGARAKAALRWRNGGEFKLMPLSELLISDPEGATVSGGRVWARFRDKLLAPFFFRSPSVTAVVRGTTLGLQVAPSGAARVAVVEGRVEVMGAGGGRAVWLEGGQAVQGGPDGTLGPIGPLHSDERSGAEPESRPARGTEVRETPLSPWARLDDLTRRGADWLERHRAAERLPLLRQEMEQRVRPEGRPAPASETQEPRRDPAAPDPAPAPPIEQPANPAPPAPWTEPAPPAATPAPVEPREDHEGDPEDEPDQPDEPDEPEQEDSQEASDE